MQYHLSNLVLAEPVIRDVVTKAFVCTTHDYAWLVRIKIDTTVENGHDVFRMTIYKRARLRVPDGPRSPNENAGFLWRPVLHQSRRRRRRCQIHQVLRAECHNLQTTYFFRDAVLSSPFASSLFLSPFRRFAELLDGAVALELGNVVDEQHSVKVIDLVLNASRE